jgi:predicted transcriptional regulator
MHTSTQITQEQIVAALQDLPKDNPLDEAIERLLFIASVQEGLAQADRGEGIEHEKVMARVDSWFE